MKTAGITFYVLIIATYLTISINAHIEWKKSLEQWREHQINNSPTVCITNTGVRYHRCYHYRGRNTQITLFEAVEQGYTPCGTCRPQAVPVYTGRPQPPIFILKNWVVMSIILSVVYWLVFLIIIRITTNQKKLESKTTIVKSHE